MLNLGSAVTLVPFKRQPRTGGNRRRGWFIALLGWVVPSIVGHG